MKLTDVKGVGQSAAGKLGAAGITSVEELAELDLRSADINGLSNQNLKKLRANAQKLLRARKDTDLTLVDGLGPSAAEKLEEAGVETIEGLVDLDLRSADVDGLSTENLQKLKRNAGYLVSDSG